MTKELSSGLLPEESVEMFKKDYPEIPVVDIADLSQVIVSLEGSKTMNPDRAYDGQPHTHTGERGKAEVKGLTMRDIRDCFIRAFIISHPYYVYDEVKRVCTLKRQEPNATLIDEANKGTEALLDGNDVYDLVGDIDPIAVSQNLTCEIEKMMGIYPNIEKNLFTQISEPGESPNPPCEGCSLKECDDKSSY